MPFILKYILKTMFKKIKQTRKNTERLKIMKEVTKQLPFTYKK